MEQLPVHLSALATQEILHIMQHKGIPPEYRLRIGIKGGGCGATFLLGFDKPQEQDLQYTHAQVPILIDKRHLMYLLGLEIDFEETQEGRGFTFSKKD
jgi:iron-sulfur cluster assembly protein